jgi:hypothetical protein
VTYFRCFSVSERLLVFLGRQCVIKSVSRRIYEKK